MCYKNTQVLLTSLKTGGVGLNLTAASNVFIMVLPNLYIYNLHVYGKLILSSLVSKTSSSSFFQDPWWNPAVEEQAIMRIHRIGQKQTVVVRRFIVKVMFQ